mgnify:CR=1 FL=1
MGLFSPRTATCGIFSPGFCGQGTLATLTFVRSEALLKQRAPAINAAGEVLLSFAALPPLTGELVPNTGRVPRDIGGIVVRVNWDYYVMGVPDIQELDRSYIEGHQIEVVSVSQFGQDHAEIALKEVGR